MNKLFVLVGFLITLSVCYSQKVVFSQDFEKIPPLPVIDFNENDSMNTIGTIINDMTLPHESKPHGVPDSYGWNIAPRVGGGPGNFKAFTSWGQLYVAAEGNSATNWRVELKNMETWILSKKTGQWTALQPVTTKLTGAAYREDFVNDAHIAGDIKVNSQGVLSITCGNGYNLHFWPQSGRATIDPTDIGNVFVSCQARLIVADPNKPDDRANCRVVLSIGGDWWLNLTAGWNNFTTNHDAFIGRFKYVRNEWRAFNAILNWNNLTQNPPPIRHFDK